MNFEMAAWAFVSGVICFAIGAISARKEAMKEFQDELDKHALSGRCFYYKRKS